MSQYSVSGYLIAVSQRTNHTVLVEGVSDQKALKYCLLKSCPSRGVSLDKIDIDSVDIVKGEGSSFGAKDKIRLIHSTSTLMNIDSKVTFFVDREFEDFDLASPEVDSFPAHKIKPPNMYLSRGHSVENYF